MKLSSLRPALGVGAAMLLAMPLGQALASSHMDAPLITLDDPANTTDVYVFRSQSEDGQTQYLTAALAVYPFEEPGIGPNNFRFDDEVLYEIHVALGDDVAKGEATLSYQFRFDTRYQNQNTIRQAFLGPIDGVFGDNQNLRQSYSVVKLDRRSNRNDKHFKLKGKPSITLLGKGLKVPPNNQGLLTPFYNQGDNGDNPAKEGVQSEAGLDTYTGGAIFDIKDGYRVFAGQRDDGFYADIQSIFDLDFSFSGQDKPFDSQGGFNVHTIVLNIPLEEFGDETVAGVYATTSRQRLTVLSEKRDPSIFGSDIQVGRQGNPVFAEALVALVDKDLYNRTPPSVDDRKFRKYAEDVELVRLLGLTPVVNVADIFIPDLIKIDLTTGPARTPNDPLFDRLAGVLAVLGGSPDPGVDDVLINGNGQPVFGGWPNGRRFGDDVVDIALLALGSGNPNLDGVTANDITYNDVFPYAATPLNGRNHPHHGDLNLVN